MYEYSVIVRSLHSYEVLVHLSIIVNVLYVRVVVLCEVGTQNESFCNRHSNENDTDTLSPLSCLTVDVDQCWQLNRPSLCRLFLQEQKASPLALVQEDPQREQPLQQIQARPKLRSALNFPDFSYRLADRPSDRCLVSCSRC